MKFKLVEIFFSLDSYSYEFIFTFIEKKSPLFAVIFF